MNKYDEIDLNSKLLSNNPIYVGDVPIFRMTFNDITSPRIGYAKYWNFINFMALTRDRLDEVNDGEDIIGPMDFLCRVLVYDMTAQEKADEHNLLEDLNDVAEIIFGSRFNIDVYDMNFVFDKGFKLTNDNYYAVSRVIRKRNGVSSPGNEDEDEGNPADEETRRLLKRRAELRKKIAKSKSDYGDKIDVDDILSVAAFTLKLPLETIYGYDMYQLVNQFSRGQMYDQYKTQVEALLHGASKDDVELKSYARKIKNESDE